MVEGTIVSWGDAFCAAAAPCWSCAEDGLAFVGAGPGVAEVFTRLVTLQARVRGFRVSQGGKS